LVPALAFARTQRMILSATSLLVDGDKTPTVDMYLLDNPDIPSKMIDVMRTSEMRYIEGSNLIMSGDSTNARRAFDQAVDLLLQSQWDLSSTPVLGSFFQDLIHKIQRDESRYLWSDGNGEQKPEPAVLDELEKLDLIPIRVDPMLRDAVEADILNTRYDIPVVVNESVLQSINFWRSRYREMIERVFREASLPLDLMYLAQVESLFKPNAVSTAYARGIWQFEKGTAIRYGLKVDKYVDERSDPEKSTRAAAHYLSDLYSMFNDWNLVLAAYNWGEGAVQRLVDKSGVNDFWSLASLKRKMPAETKNHVPLIMASIILAHNPEKYGLSMEFEPPLACDRVPVPKRVNLKAVSKALNISVDLLRNLNPSLKTLYTPPDNPHFELNVPEGMGVDLTEKLASMPAADLKADPEFDGHYKIQPGDTFTAIAARFKISVEDLKAANNLGSPKSLRAGSTLMVPTKGTAAHPAARVADFKARHQVKAGETMFSIAQRYGIAVAALQNANKLESAASLRAGAWLNVPQASAHSEAPSGKPAVGARHQIKSGETLGSIAARYGISASALQKANRIQSPRSLKVGAWLQIPAATKKG
jgi:membrane-bound lytic murein transglycosylase D